MATKKSTIKPAMKIAINPPVAKSAVVTVQEGGWGSVWIDGFHVRIRLRSITEADGHRDATLFVTFRPPSSGGE